MGVTQRPNTWLTQPRTKGRRRLPLRRLRTTRCLWQPGEESQSKSLEKCRLAAFPLLTHTRWRDYFTTLNPVIYKQNSETFPEMCYKNTGVWEGLLLLWTNTPSISHHRGAPAPSSNCISKCKQRWCLNGRFIWPNVCCQFDRFTLNSSRFWVVS